MNSLAVCRGFSRTRWGTDGVYLPAQWNARSLVRVDPDPWCLDDTRLLYVHGSYVALQRVENPIRHEGKEFKTLSGWSREPVGVARFPASRYFRSHKWILRLAVDSTRWMGVGTRTFVIHPGEYPRVFSDADEETVRTAIRNEAVFRFEAFDDEWVLVGTLSEETRDRFATLCAEILKSLELNE